MPSNPRNANRNRRFSVVWCSGPRARLESDALRYRKSRIAWNPLIPSGSGAPHVRDAVSRAVQRRVAALPAQARPHREAVPQVHIGHRFLRLGRPSRDERSAARRGSYPPDSPVTPSRTAGALPPHRHIVGTEVGIHIAHGNPAANSFQSSARDDAFPDALDRTLPATWSQPIKWEVRSIDSATGKRRNDLFANSRPGAFDLAAGVRGNSCTRSGMPCSPGWPHSCCR